MKPTPKRKVGSTDYCVICGKEYVINSGSQKACSGCRVKLRKYTRNMYLAYRRELDKTGIDPKGIHLKPNRCRWCNRIIPSVYPYPICCSTECYILWGKYI